MADKMRRKYVTLSKLLYKTYTSQISEGMTCNHSHPTHWVLSNKWPQKTVLITKFSHRVIYNLASFSPEFNIELETLQ